MLIKSADLNVEKYVYNESVFELTVSKLDKFYQDFLDGKLTSRLITYGDDHVTIEEKWV